MRARIQQAISFIGGHADVWATFRDGELFAEIVEALAAPFADRGVTKVIAIESRGFILGGAVGVRLGAGFAAVRKAEGLYPGPKVERRTATPDYRGKHHNLRLQRAAISPADRVLLVDDWIETGSQALAVRKMVEECGGEFVGVAVVVDQLDHFRRSDLGQLHSLVAASDLAENDP